MVCFEGLKPCFLYSLIIFGMNSTSGNHSIEKSTSACIVDAA